jgi:LPS export ABC transporter protein LptC
MTRPGLPAIGLITAALLTTACDSARNALSLPKVLDTTQMRRGYSATDAELSATDSQGRQRYKLRAASIRQEEGQEAVDLTQVVVEFPDSRGQKWLLTANSGRMSSTARDAPAIVDLAGDVRLASDANSLGGQLSLETSTLSYDTVANRATTDQPVKLKSGTRTIEARGLTADLGTRRLKLESAVHGRFTP